MAFTRTAVGNKIWVYSPNGERPQPYTRHCVITAHGAQAADYATFTVPQYQTVRFLGPDGHPLTASLKTVTSGKAPPFEDRSAGSPCRDYELGKFDDPKEGRKFIETGMHPKTRDEFVADLRAMHFTEHWIETSWEMADKTGPVMDVVTIRLNRFRSGPTLSEVIGSLNAAGYHYNTIWCSFCRWAPGSVHGLGKKAADTRVKSMAYTPGQL
jgi:hypothetical protein